MVKRKKRSWDSQIFTKVKTVALDDITADLDMQQRAESYDEIISEYAEILKSGGELAPLKVIRDENNTLWLWDGFHTLQAAKRAGQDKIKAEISRGTRREAWIKSLGANETHGIRRSRADRQKAVDSALNDPEIKLSLLEEDGLYSFRSIAKLCAVDHKTVSKRWNENHLPRTLDETEQELGNGPPSESSISEQAWLIKVAKDLSLPTWWVSKCWVEKQAKLTTSEPELESDNNLTSGESPTDQAVSTRFIEAPVAAREEKTRDNNLTSRESPTDQHGSTRFIEVSAEEEEASDKDLTSGESPTDQTENTRIDNEPTPEPTHLTTVELITTPESALPTNIAVHHPTEPQHYSGQEAVQLLTGYMNKQIGVKVIEAQRPEGGWSAQVGQEIGRALSQITDTGVENIDSILIVVVQG